MIVNTVVQTYGMREAIAHIIQHRERMGPGKRTQAAVKGAEKARELLRAEIAIPKSGRKWWNLPNRSSREGEVPAQQHGELQDKMKIIAGAEGPGTAVLEAFSPQAGWMEYGFTVMTSSGPKFVIRPWMRPTIDTYRSEIQDEMKAALR